jgi:hypothetical protein
MHILLKQGLLLGWIVNISWPAKTAVPYAGSWKAKPGIGRWGGDT